ncbi:ribonuclease T2 family protein [Terracidiphilus sp.]|jgi:ribonuclease T2|uniref:ribonuclease T2 family protein n=1 Tax=Terracidiphilus sp. TaxID=1964191 RepID=UPI003C24410B
MKLKLLSITLLLTLAACKSHAPDASGPGTAIDPPIRPNPRLAAATGFDFYLLNLSWSPEYCHSHPEAAECASHSTFVLHGLWPQNKDGSYPQNCGNGPGSQTGPDASRFSDIYPEPGLLEHEWRTHGTCSGLSANDFFSAARSAYQSVKIPSQLTNLSSQTSLSPEQIAALFTQATPGLSRESIAISCGHNYLTAVAICLNKSLHPIACPAVRSCRANSVRIAPPR